MNRRRALWILLIVAASLAWFFERDKIAAEEPRSDARDPPVQAEAPLPPDGAEGLPPVPSDPRAMLEDPLFQSILREFRDGREALIPSDAAQKGQVVPESKRRLHSAEWRAIELILRAARILEADDKRLAEVEKGKATLDNRATVQQLRSIVAQRIGRAVEP